VLVRTAILLLAATLVACSSTPERPATYTVKRGDTLYAIAWRHRLDYHDLARWNGIGRDYLIYPGQVLRLYPPSKGSARGAPPPKKSTRQATQPSRPQPSPARVASNIKWRWPVEGGSATLTSRPNGGQGLTIAGRRGADILAAAGGRVVYTGTGLLGYGQLVIIKHDDTYLSAYGHTDTVLVKEGQTVAAGQKIATMGAGPQGTPQLYFEIRVNGSPRNPLALLPQRR